MGDIKLPSETVYQFSRKNQIMLILVYLLGGWWFGWMASFSVSANDSASLTYFAFPFLRLFSIGMYVMALWRFFYFLDPFLLSVTKEGIRLRKYGFIPWGNIQRIGSSHLDLVFQFSIPNEAKYRTPPISRFFRGKYRRKGKIVLVGFMTGNVGLHVPSEKIWNTLRAYYAEYMAPKMSYDLDKPLGEIPDSKIRDFDNKLKSVFSDSDKIRKAF